MGKGLPRFLKTPLGTRCNKRSLGVFRMNKFLLLTASALVGILVSSCAPIPRQMVPKYGSHSGAPHYLPPRHPPRRAQVHHRMPHVTDHHHHPQRRATSEGQRRSLRPWDHLPAVSEPPAPTNVTPPPQDHSTDPDVSKPLLNYKMGPPRYWRWEK
jgi:hypothetical protein